MAANDKQVGGTHYQGAPIQHWDFVVMHGIPYLEATAIKYLMRHGQKNGRVDLEKALHYIEKALETYYPHKPCKHPVTSVRKIVYFDGRDSKYETQCLNCTDVWRSSDEEIACAKQEESVRYSESSAPRSTTCLHRFLQTCVIIGNGPGSGTGFIRCANCRTIVTMMGKEPTNQLLLEESLKGATLHEPMLDGEVALGAVKGHCRVCRGPCALHPAQGEATTPPKSPPDAHAAQGLGVGTGPQASISPAAGVVLRNRYKEEPYHRNKAAERAKSDEEFLKSLGLTIKDVYHTDHGLVEPGVHESSFVVKAK